MTQDDSISVVEADLQTESRIPIAPSEPRLSLLVMSERGVFTYPLPDSGVVRIGRAARCEVIVGDAQLSREHVAIVVGRSLEIVDLASANGTRVSGRELVPHQPAPLHLGDLVSLGSTVLVVQRSATEARSRHLWSHGYFESRLEEECARAHERKTTFAILRVRFDAARRPGAVESRLSASVSPDHVVAAYAPGQYEVLLTDVSSDEAEREAEALVARLTGDGPRPEVTMACYPRDGRTPEALMAGTRPRREGDSLPIVAPGGTLDRIRTIAERFAAGTIPVLVLGETGVGKDVIASLIHRLSPRASRPYVCINCGALPGTLLESELFGHERGAFTGAAGSKAGLLESANEGTVFLDEIGELPLSAQATLLRVLDQGEVLRLGATRPRTIDVRFIAATNRDLEHEVERGRFRRDLYFRLAAATIEVPPLRERFTEIAPLAHTFVREACRELTRSRVPRILPDALLALERHSWPGNVRELRNVMERAVLLAADGDIGLGQLPVEKMGARRLPTQGPPSSRRSHEVRATLPPDSRSDEPTEVPASTAPPAGRAPSDRASRGSSVPPLHVTARVTDLLARDPEAAKLFAVLDACDWNQTKAAAQLGVSRRTLVSRLSAYGLTRKRTK